MKTTGNTILITGGASGIGFAFAERFLALGNEVIICGRRESKLNEAKEKYPKLHTRVVDVAVEKERVALVKWVQDHFPQVNVLMNNAGIQRRVELADHEDWSQRQQEIAINFEAPVHLTTLFLDHLKKQQHAAIINVTSGLAFAPTALAPIYCATKAAFHSFTLTLRHQVAKEAIEVIEVIPPAVNTDLGGPGLHTFGAPVDDFADTIMEEIKNGKIEIGYGTAEEARLASRQELDQRFAKMNP